MERLVLYCKSYRNDFERFKILLESVVKYNVDKIPFYVSVPDQDTQLFKQLRGVEVVSDESISTAFGLGWVQQQIIKSNFWKLKLCKNYLCIDSDSYFIKPFSIEDFMYDDETPYTVMHEQKDLFEWTSKNHTNLGFEPFQGFIDTRKPIMELFNRKGRIYDFGPGPVIWSSKVWKSLEDNYLIPNNLKFENLIETMPSEFTWYGEYLLVSKEIDIIPIEPMFKFFHFANQYIDFKNQNYTEEHFKQNYLGIVMQSNWGAPLKY